MIVPWLGNDCSLQSPFQFTSHLPFKHSTSYSLATDSITKQPTKIPPLYFPPFFSSFCVKAKQKFCAIISHAGIQCQKSTWTSAEVQYRIWMPASTLMMPFQSLDTLKCTLTFDITCHKSFTPWTYGDTKQANITYFPRLQLFAQLTDWEEEYV